MKYILVSSVLLVLLLNPDACFAVNCDAKEIQYAAEKMHVTKDDACMLYNNISFRIDSAQKDMRRIASMVPLDSKYKSHDYITKEAIPANYENEYTKVQVGLAKRKSVKIFNVYEYLTRLADLGRDKRYTDVEVVYLPKDTRYGLPESMDGVTYTISADTWTVFNANGENHYNDLTNKIYVFKFTKKGDKFEGLKIKEITVRVTLGEDEFDIEDSGIITAKDGTQLRGRLK